MDSPNIAMLIQATLLATLTSCSTLECPEEHIDVAERTIDTEVYAELIEAIAEFDVVWDELDADEKCVVACARSSGNLLGYFDGSVYLDTCALTLIVEGDEVVEGQLSCEGYAASECYGRRPLDWQPTPSLARDLQTHLDEMATMEHASSTAFAELAEQLRSLAAPEQLVTRCLAAARDERRHAQLVSTLGAAEPELALEPAAASTSVLTIALHNAIEGCVNETWAALLAHHQSRNAIDETTREAFTAIALDEAQHARLAWDIHAWLLGLLDAREAALIDDTLTSALGSLQSTARTGASAVPSAVRLQLGLPAPARASALASDFAARLMASRPTPAHSAWV